MSQLSNYRGAQSTIQQPGEQKAGQIARLLEQLREGQDTSAQVITQIQAVLDDDAALDTPLLTSATVTEIRAELSVAKDGGTMGNGKDAVGTTVLGTMIDTIVSA